MSVIIRDNTNNNFLSEPKKNEFKSSQEPCKL